MRYGGCRLVRQSGFWMHHLRAVPEADVRAHDYTLLMIDGVEMNADVDLHVLVRVMEANCLQLAGPACGSCKSKQLIRPVRDKPAYAVGRRVQYLDPQIQLYTGAAFLCLQRLIDVVGLQADPTGWSISMLSTSFCSNRVGVVDAMGVEKIYSKSTYSWEDAEKTVRARARRPRGRTRAAHAKHTQSRPCTRRAAGDPAAGMRACADVRERAAALTCACACDPFRARRRRQAMRPSAECPV